jgi:hypothetical protein
VDMLLENLKYCQQHRGLQVYAWVVMWWCQIIVIWLFQMKKQISRMWSEILKSTPLKLFLKAICANEKESRREWLTMVLKKDDKIWFWEPGYHGEELVTKSF